MDKIINDLVIGQVLHTTNQGTKYFLVKVLPDNSIRYSINQNCKTLPIATIKAALTAFLNGDNINRQWYLVYNEQEATTRGCNLRVLNNLLERMNQ